MHYLAWFPAIMASEHFCCCIVQLQPPHEKIAYVYRLYLFLLRFFNLNILESCKQIQYTDQRLKCVKIWFWWDIIFWGFFLSLWISHKPSDSSHNHWEKLNHQRQSVQGYLYSCLLQLSGFKMSKWLAKVLNLNLMVFTSIQKHFVSSHREQIVDLAKCYGILNPLF